MIVVSGFLHYLFNVTIDARGGFHVKQHNQPQGLSGVGLTTCDKYQGTGVTQYSENLSPGVTYSYVNNFRMFGQGKATTTSCMRTTMSRSTQMAS